LGSDLNFTESDKLLAKDLKEGRCKWEDLGVNQRNRMEKYFEIDPIIEDTTRTYQDVEAEIIEFEKNKS